MTYYNPNPSYEPARITIPNALGYSAGGIASLVPASAACVANQAYYVPFVAPGSGRIITVEWYDGAGTNNYDICLLSAAGVVLASKGAAAASAAAKNTWTLTNPWPVRGGLGYWIGWYAINSAVTIASWPSSAITPTTSSMAIRASATFTVGNTETFAVAGTQITPIFAITLGY